MSFSFVPPFLILEQWAYFMGEGNVCQALFVAEASGQGNLKRGLLRARSGPDLHDIFGKMVYDFLVSILLQIKRPLFEHNGMSTFIR